MCSVVNENMKILLKRNEKVNNGLQELRQKANTC